MGYFKLRELLGTGLSHESNFHKSLSLLGAGLWVEKLLKSIRLLIIGT